MSGWVGLREERREVAGLVRRILQCLPDEPGGCIREQAHSYTGFEVLHPLSEQPKTLRERACSRKGQR